MLHSWLIVIFFHVGQYQTYRVYSAPNKKNTNHSNTTTQPHRTTINLNSATSPPPMPPDPKVKKWGKSDEKILYDLTRTGVIKIEDISAENIERVRQAHFSHRCAKNFRRNFRNYSARLDLEELFIGARRRAAKEGELRVC